MNSQTQESFRLILQNLFIGAFYFITGYLCLFLAFSPSNSAAVWAPAGIALGACLVYGARILPGIYLGAFLVNFYYQPSSEILFFLCFGAVLQAWLTERMIRHWAKIDLSAYRIKYILLFAMIAGPVGCLINATYTNFILALFNQIPAHGMWQSWMTWWAGDSIGALTITPMFLILFAKPRETWKPRIIPILLPLSLCFSITILLASLVMISLEDHKAWEAYFVLFSGLLFCTLMNITLSIIYGQKILIQNEVQEKTQALKKALHDLEKIADFDSLTNMPNRRSFMKYLQNCIARSQRQKLLVAVCIIDLDNFKEINDSLGHAYGDALLQMIPKIFAPLLRKSDYIARLGGDEFGLILEDVKSISHISQIVDRISETLNKPIEILKTEVYTSLSIGIAIFPNGGTDPEILIRHADIAMYRAKKSGKNSFQFFNEEINQQMQRRQNIITQLQKALLNNEFYLHYEPQFDTQTRHLSGLDATLKWRNTHLGDIDPNEFIPIAEENKKIFAISEWALEKACTDLIQFRLNCNKKTDLSLNLSIKLIENEKFLDFIAKLAQRFNFVTNTLFIEISISDLLKNPEERIQALHRIQAQGVQFILKDFGIGYCSLMHLKTLPISALKINSLLIANFLKNKNDLEIVNAIIGLTKTLGYRSIAEGVETHDQYECLAQLGCDVIQGLYLAEASTATGLMEKIR